MTTVERETAAGTLRAECSEAYRGLAADVLAAFEVRGATAEGAALRYAGASLVLVREGDALRVTEPDYRHWPDDRRSPTIDVTLRVLAAQVRLLRRLGVAGVDALLDGWAVAAAGALARPNVYLHRLPAESADDTGWFLGDADAPGGGELEAVQLAALVTRRPALLEVVALPVGFMAVFAGETLSHVYDADGRSLLAPPAATKRSAGANGGPIPRNARELIRARLEGEEPR